MEQATVQKNVAGGLPDAQAVNHRVGYQTEGLNDQVVGGAIPQQKVRQGLQQENAGTNQDDQLDAGSDESAPIGVVAARAERRRHKRSVRCATQWRQSEVSTYVIFVDGCGAAGEDCGEKTPEKTGLPRQAFQPAGRLLRASRVRRGRRMGSGRGEGRRSRSGWVRR